MINKNMQWRCYAEGAVVVTESYLGTNKVPVTIARQGRTLAEEAEFLVERKIYKRNRSRSRMLAPMTPTPYDPETAFRDGSVIVQPWINGVRVLVYWHSKGIVIQSTSGALYDLPHILKHLRGPVTKAGASGPLQNDTILDGWLTVAGENPIQVMKRLRTTEEWKAVRLLVQDVATTRGGGWAERTGVRRHTCHRFGTEDALSRIDRCVGGPVGRVPAEAYAGGFNVEGRRGCIVRPANAPYRFGRCDSMQLIGEK